MNDVSETWTVFQSRYFEYDRLAADAANAKNAMEKAKREFDDVFTATLDGERIGLAHSKIKRAEAAYAEISDKAYAAKERLTEAACDFMREFSRSAE